MQSAEKISLLLLLLLLLLITIITLLLLLHLFLLELTSQKLVWVHVSFPFRARAFGEKRSEESSLRTLSNVQEESRGLFSLFQKKTSKKGCDLSALSPHYDARLRKEARRFFHHHHRRILISKQKKRNSRAHSQ